MIKFAVLCAAAAVFTAGQIEAAEPARTYSCVFEPPMGTTLNDGKFARNPVGFTDTKTPWEYRFTLAPAAPGETTDLTVESKRDFATIAGEYPALAVAPNTYVATAIKTGNCMFSSGLCGAFIQLTNLDSDQAAASIDPVSYLGDQKGARFLHVDIVGECTVVSNSEGDK